MVGLDQVDSVEYVLFYFFFRLADQDSALLCADEDELSIARPLEADDSERREAGLRDQASADLDDHDARCVNRAYS